MAVSFTQTDYQTLCSMIAKGVTSLDLGNGERVTYRSLDEMMRLKAAMEQDLGLKSRPKVIYPAFRKG